ncbi:hypothetical protein [Microbacterium sp. SSM24]|uniref:hypothetical protein n=1 Tax=Microbacterium sp. SSM24 TaxID=2991714 RepID=UPI0022276277|nr:hypothetical protein [Microbacterium sp. SSM24]MCW3493912.1 hypothetical protein [Microbacterium sp. SSM24]
MSAARSGGVGAIVFAVAGLVWFATELTPPLMGYDDTDSAVVMIGFLQDHPWVYATGGLALLVMAGALVPAALGIAGLVADGRDSLAARCSAVAGCFAAAFFGLQGVLRLGGGPLLYIADLDPAAGRAGYTAVQLLGVQGALQAALMSLCAWAVLAAMVGRTRRTLPRAIVWTAVVPALRALLLLAGPFGILPAELWLLAIPLIPLTLLWCGALGIAVVVRTRPVEP